jgi:protease I
MSELSGVRVLVLATDGVEEAELTEPVKALKEAGARVEVAAPKAGEIQTFRHHDKFDTFPADRALEGLDPDDYDALFLPGGAFNADALRAHPKVKDVIRVMMDAGRPVAMICHAPWELISAGMARGRTMTGYRTIEDDVRNAGGVWEDADVVIDGNLVSSREPADLPAFIVEMKRVFKEIAAPKPVKEIPIERIEPRILAKAGRGTQRRAKRKSKASGPRAPGRPPGPDTA